MVTRTIDITDLCVAYGETTVLDGINTHVETGEIAVILGGSGCGKSTLAGSKSSTRILLHWKKKTLALCAKGWE